MNLLAELTRGQLPMVCNSRFVAFGMRAQDGNPIALVIGRNHGWALLPFNTSPADVPFIAPHVG